VGPGGVRALVDWLEVRGSAPGPILVRVYGDKPTSKGLSPRTVAAILKRIVARAGLTQKVSPHDFRRTFVGDLIDEGADLSAIQKLAGHAQVTTTQRYDRRGKRVLAAAAERLRVPYEGRAG
jgi:site-specific recombinase XerD